MSLLQKALRSAKTYGRAATLGKIARKLTRETLHLPGRVREKLIRHKAMAQLSALVTGKRVFVIMPSIEWHIPLLQRPHQIARVLAGLPSSIVLYISDEFKYDNFAYYEAIDVSMVLYSIRVMADLPAILEGAANVTAIKSWPMHADKLMLIPYDKLVYEYIDDMSLLYYYDEQLKRWHEQLLREADLVTASAAALVEKARPFAQKLLLAENAGDYMFFAQNRNSPVNPLIRDAVARYELVIGYYGSLAQWVDYDAVNQVATNRPSWLFVLVGHDYDGSYRQLRNLPNILRVPAQPYAALPSVINGFDLLTIPFVVNEITQATSPVKLFEYMASGRPIVTSALPECKKYKSVILYDAAEDFESRLAYAATLRYDDGYLRLMDDEARANTWQARVQAILDTLEES